MHTWGVVYKPLTLGWWAITVATHPCSHPILNELAVFTAMLPVNPTNMRWDHVCSQWEVQWEGLRPKMNKRRLHSSRKTSQPERLIRGYPPWHRGMLPLWCGLLALNSLPEKRQEKGGHTVTSKCPFPWLGASSSFQACAKEASGQHNSCRLGRLRVAWVGQWVSGSVHLALLLEDRKRHQSQSRPFTSLK